MLFARDVPGPLGMLLKQIEDTIAQNKAADMRSFAAFPTADRKGMEPKLLQLAQQAKLSEAYSLVIPEDPATVKPYKLNPEAELTVVLFKKWKVVGNFAFKAGQFKDADVAPIVAALVKIVPSKEELEQDAKEQREAEKKRKEAEAKRKADEAKKKASEAKTAQKK